MPVSPVFLFVSILCAAELTNREQDPGSFAQVSSDPWLSLEKGKVADNSKVIIGEIFPSIQVFPRDVCLLRRMCGSTMVLFL